MNRPRTAEFIEATAFICIVVAMALTWYYGYVKPADEMRYQIMDCMDEQDDRSASGYRHCFEELKGHRGK